MSICLQWRPDLSLYGNEFMLATADAMLDPDFSAEGPENAELKAFFFSYVFQKILAVPKMLNVSLIQLFYCFSNIVSDTFTRSSRKVVQ